MAFGKDFVDVTIRNLAETGTEFLEAQEVGVKTTTAYLVATGFGNDSLAHTSQQRTNHHDGTAQLGALLDEFVAFEECHVKGIGLEGKDTF